MCDDDPQVVEAFSAVLGAHGFRAVGVTDGALAVGLLATERPDVVLLDLLMPATTGAEVLAAVRASEGTDHVPVVIVSGLGPEADPETADVADDWLVEPVSQERLVATVARALAGTPLAGTPRAGSVLLVEDDEPLALVLDDMLSAEGLDVVRAASASQAIRLGQELRPDVLVLDVHLSDGTGSEVVEELGRSGTLAGTALVVHGAAPVAPEVREALRLGETRFLEKGRPGPGDLVDQVLELVHAATRPSSTAPDSGSSDGGAGHGGTDNRS